MPDYKSAVSMASNCIRAASAGLRQIDWQEQIRTLWLRLQEIDYKTKALGLYQDTSHRIARYKQGHEERSRTSQKSRTPAPARTNVSFSVPGEADCRNRAVPHETSRTQSKSGLEALELAEQRYALLNQAQVAERRRLLVAQRMHIVEELQQLEERKMELMLLQATIASEEAALAVTERDTATSNRHSTNNLYG